MQRKKTTRKKSSSGNRRRQEHLLIKPLSILLIMMTLCVGAYWNVNNGSVSEQMADSKIAAIESGKASGKDMDYTAAAGDLQNAVDTWLKAQGAEVSTIETTNRSEDRRATGGTIRWTVQKTQVVPTKTFSRSDLEKVLSKSQGKAILYNVEKTKLEETDVTEYDIALFDMLDQEQLSMVVDKLYVTEPGRSTTILGKVKAFIAGAIKGNVKEKQSTAVEHSSSAPVRTEKHPDQVKARLAIVIDDFGARKDVVPTFNHIAVPLTYAVMPNKQYTTECAESGYNAGRHIFVHVPMQPIKVSSSESVYISPDMTKTTIQSTLKGFLNQVPHAIGANNHQGSYATSDEATMKAVMEVIKARQLEFLDSRTNSTSVAAQTASAMGVATGRNNLFIDNDDDVASIQSRLRQAGQIALNNGSCIVIGHCRPNTAEAIRSMIDELHGQGIDIVFVSQLM